MKLSELRTLCDEAEALMARLEERVPIGDGSPRVARLRIALRHAEERFDRRLRKLYRRPDRPDVRPTEERLW
jgi:hypothetical protein